MFVSAYRFGSESAFSNVSNKTNEVTLRNHKNDCKLKHLKGMTKSFFKGATSEEAEVEVINVNGLVDFTRNLWNLSNLALKTEMATFRALQNSPCSKTHRDKTR
jgi:hypothetical protein